MLSPVFRCISALLILAPGFTFANSYDISGFIGVGGEYIDMLELDLDESQSILESGVRASVTLPKNLALNAQVLYTDESSSSDDEPELDYATLDWQFSTSLLAEQKLSLGRFKANGGIYSNTRDMPFTRPGIVLSDSIYGDGFRSIYKHIDGIRWDTSYSGFLGTWDLELGYGVHNADEDLGSTVLGQTANATSYDAENSVLVNLKYQTLSLLANLTYRRLDLDTQQEINQITIDDMELNSYIASLQYLIGDWEFTLESIMQDVTLTQGFETDTLFGYYLQTRYFLSPTMTVLLCFDQSDNYNSQIDTIDSGNRYRITTSTAETYTIGVSWRPAEQWQLAAEVHHLPNNNTTTLAQLAWRF